MIDYQFIPVIVNRLGGQTSHAVLIEPGGEA